MERAIVITLAVVFFVCFGYLVFFRGYLAMMNIEKPKVENYPDGIIQFKEVSYDFGMIKQSGGKVSHAFEFIYNGVEPIEITGVPTSCACTNATIDKAKLEKGDKGLIAVEFNPNLHAEPEGKFFKTISLLTEPSMKNIPEVKIWLEIDLDLGPEAFELKSEHTHEEEIPHGHD